MKIRVAENVHLQLLPFTIDYYDEVYRLWSGCSGIGLSEADSKEHIERYLLHNPGLSMLAFCGDRLVGACLAGHDGRRGYLHHLAVHAGYRRRGIGRVLVDECLARLRDCEISKCHLFLFQENLDGREFWESQGWSFRHDLGVISKPL